MLVVKKQNIKLNIFENLQNAFFYMFFFLFLPQFVWRSWFTVLSENCNVGIVHSKNSGNLFVKF